MRRMLAFICGLVCFAARAESQQLSCRYSGVCATDPLSASCRLTLYYTDCQGYEKSKTFWCYNSTAQCKQNCSCKCIERDAPTGYRGAFPGTTPVGISL